MTCTTLIGLSASICTAASLLPQLIKIIRTRKSEDVSYGMLLILLTGLGLWIWYGIRIKDLIITLSNGCSLIINLITMYAGLVFRKQVIKNK